MRRHSKVAFVVVAVMGPLVSGAAGAFAAPNTAVTTTHRVVRVCATPAPGTAACEALRAQTQSATGAVVASDTPSGYGPGDLRGAYKLPSTSDGAGETVAVVDAYNDPDAVSDLATYRAQFGEAACTVASGCFRQVNQNGSSTGLPANNGSWAEEESVDVDMVSAICPKCRILLVEAKNNANSNLGAAENEAAALGAHAISDSFAGAEGDNELSEDTKFYDHPGIAETASAGDYGYGVAYPAASPYVTAVGGTTLTKAPSTARGWTERAWSTSSSEGTGSGCSAYERQPSWQSTVANITRPCGDRAVTDVSADADPATGVAVYDSYPYQGVSGWLDFGGTSVAAPIIASVYALAGNTSSIDNASHLYAHTGHFFDVTTGSTSSCGSDLCKAVKGWDGPTGLGTPHGVLGF